MKNDVLYSPEIQESSYLNESELDSDSETCFIQFVSSALSIELDK